MLEENLRRCHVKIGATDFFLAFSFCSKSLDRNEFLIVLVIFLFEIGVSRTKIAKIWELYNFSNLVTSITPLFKDIILKNSSSLWDFSMRVKSVGQTPIFLFSLFFAPIFSHSTFARVSHCFDFFQKFFLVIFNELVITLKFISLALITLGFFISFFWYTCNLQPRLDFRECHVIRFSRVVIQMKPKLEWTIWALVSFCLYKTIENALGYWRIESNLAYL